MNKLLFMAILVVSCLASAAHTGMEATLLVHGKEDVVQNLNTHEPGWESVNFVAHVFPPFQYKKDGVLVGPFMEIMRQICTKAALNCNVHMHSWKIAYEDLISGEADGMFSFLISEDPARVALVKYGPEIVETYYSFFVSSTSNWNWTGRVADLDGRTVGVYGLGSGTYITARNLVSQNPSAKLVVEETNLKAFQQLVIGKYGQKAAVIANKDVGLALLQSANIHGPRPAGDIQKEYFSFAFSRNSKKQDLYPRLCTAAQLLKDSGVIAAILKNYDLVPAK